MPVASRNAAAFGLRRGHEPASAQMESGSNKTASPTDENQMKCLFAAALLARRFQMECATGAGARVDQTVHFAEQLLALSGFHQAMV
jgi:hypothetical protein